MYIFTSLNQYSTKHNILQNYSFNLFESIKPFEFVCACCAFCQKSGFSLSLTHKTQIAQPNIPVQNQMLFKKKNSDLIYTVVPVHFVGCVHITSQKLQQHEIQNTGNTNAW